MMTRTPPHKWTFPARFRRGAFGWKSALPIQRLKEAVAEIRAVSVTARPGESQPIQQAGRPNGVEDLILKQPLASWPE